MKNEIFPRMHVSLYVSDLEKTIDFYRHFFGQEPEKVKPGYAKFILVRPSLVISFVENRDRANSGFGHLGFQVENMEQMEQRLEKMKALDLVSLEERGTACCYALQDKFWATDPDGHQWEVYYFHQDSEFNDPQYAQEDSASCCTPAEKTDKRERALAAGETACCEPASDCC